MTSDLPITTRNFHAKLVLISGTRVVLREVLFGEQVKLAGNRFASEVTPMQHGRFRLIQVKDGVKAPMDLKAQAVDRITRRGANAPAGGLGPMPRPSREDADVFDVTHSGIPYRGRIEVFNGRGAIHGTDERTGEPCTVLLKDLQVMEVKRRRPKPRQVPAEDIEAYYARPEDVASEDAGEMAGEADEGHAPASSTETSSNSADPADSDAAPELVLSEEPV